MPEIEFEKFLEGVKELNHVRNILNDAKFNIDCVLDSLQLDRIERANLKELNYNIRHAIEKLQELLPRQG